MKKYIEILLGGKRYRFLIDEELDDILRKNLKERYKFNNDNVLVLEDEDLITSYKNKQLILKSLLSQINTYDLSPDFQTKIDSLNNYLDSRSTVYYSDLAKLESILGEASEMYSSVRANLPKKEIAQTQRETTSQAINEVKDIVDKNLDEDRSIPSDNESSTDNKLAEFEELLDELALDEEFKDIVPVSDIKDAMTRVVVCTSMAEFIDLTRSNITPYDIVNAIENKSEKIVLPPQADLEKVAIEILKTCIKDDNTVSKVITYVERKTNFQTKTNNAFESLRSNLKISGFTARNLNYFSDQFFDEFERICADTGISFETMFADYFNGYSTNRKYNSPLDKFLRLFNKYNGGDEQTRALLEAALVKKAISRHLISSKYNNYLKDEYKNLNVNGSGYINFDNIFADLNQLNTSSTISSATSLAAGSPLKETQNLQSRANLNTEASIERRGKLNSRLSSNMENASTLNMQEELIESQQAAKANLPTDTIDSLTDEEDTVNISFNGPNIPSSGTNVGAPNIIGNAIDGTSAKKLEPVDYAKEDSDKRPNPKIIPFPSSRASKQNKFNNAKRNNTGSGVVISIGSNNIVKKNVLLSQPPTQDNNDVIIAEDEEDVFADDSYPSPNSPSNESPQENDANLEETPEAEDNNQPSAPPLGNIQGQALDELKNQTKKAASKAVSEFIKKNPYVLIIGGIVLLILIIFITMADIEQQRKSAYKSSSSGCAGEGGNLASFLGGWEGTSGASCTINGLSGNTAVDQNDGTLTTGAGVTNHLISSVSDYISANNLGNYFHYNSSNKTYYMNEGDCIPSEVSDELKEVGVREIYAAPIESIAAELGLELTEYQKDAITSFNYNLGPGHTRELLTAYKEDGYEGLWNKMKLYVKSQGAVLSGLKRRRKGEFALFVTGDYSDQGAFYSRSLDNYDDYDSESVMSREYYCISGVSDELIADASGFLARLSRPTRNNSFYYDQTTGLAYTDYEGECSWYAGHRAKEILSNMNISKSWNSMPDGGKYCRAQEVTSGQFTSSRNVTSPRPGSLISWSKGTDYGHVAVVEQVFNDGSILISEGYISLGIYGKSARSTIHKYSNVREIRRKNCEGNGTGCFTTRKLSASQISNAGWSGYRFECYIYLR